MYLPICLLPCYMNRMVTDYSPEDSYGMSQQHAYITVASSDSLPSLHSIVLHLSEFNRKKIQILLS